MQQKLKQLKCSNSLLLEEGMPVLWPKQDQPGQLKVSKIIQAIKVKKAYAYTSKVIAIIDNGEMRVTPFTTESLEIVRNAGYKLHECHVPFSNGDLPQGEYGEKWQQLVAAAKKRTSRTAATDDLQVRRVPQAAVATA